MTCNFRHPMGLGHPVIRAIALSPSVMNTTLGDRAIALTLGDRAIVMNTT